MAELESWEDEKASVFEMWYYLTLTQTQNTNTVQKIKDIYGSVNKLARWINCSWTTINEIL